MRVLVFRHVPFEGGGRLHDILEPRGVSLEYVDLCGPGAEKAADAEGLVFMGGPMSVNDDLPYLRREIDIISQAMGRGQPLMGVCLGAQLIAKACGAAVVRNPQKEIGWFDVHLTDAGFRDRLFEGLDPSETVFHWHGETFDLPRGAVHLAYSGRCRNQAFRIGESGYGLQFHLEATPAMISGWCLEDANCGDVRELDAPIDAGAHAARMNVLAELVFGRWCTLL